MTWQPSPLGQKRIDELVDRYPSKMAACLPALRVAQEELGWVSPDVIQWVSRRLEIPLAHVQGVVSFYTLFHREPVGKHVVQVCRTLSCALLGADRILARCQEKLGIRVGETTPDGRVTLQTAECLASCGTAPVLTVDDQFHENLTLSQVDSLLAELRRS